MGKKATGALLRCLPSPTGGDRAALSVRLPVKVPCPHRAGRQTASVQILQYLSQRYLSALGVKSDKRCSTKDTQNNSKMLQQKNAANKETMQNQNDPNPQTHAREKCCILSQHNGSVNLFELLLLCYCKRLQPNI